MSKTPYNPDPPDVDRLLELCRQRVEQWEKAPLHSRTEHEQAEAFTRAFAELDEVLSHQGKLPRAWMAGRRMVFERVPVDEDDGSVYPVQNLLGGHSVRMEKDT